jgi:hypothetical protein
MKDRGWRIDVEDRYLLSSIFDPRCVLEHRVRLRTKLDSRFHGNIHYHFAITLDDESSERRGEAGDRRHRTIQVLPGPDHWNKQPTGLAGVAIEAEAHWLRSEALP